MESIQATDLFGDIAVEPTEPAAAYLGGKRSLAKRLVRLIDSANARLYAEPFVGMGGVFLRRRIQAPVEVINDYSQDVATFFRILQRHRNQFYDVLRYQVASRAEFDRLVQTDPQTLTDLERAARFLLLQAMGFGAKPQGRGGFGVSRVCGSKFTYSSIIRRLEAVHRRLDGVYIERKPFGEFVAMYDGPDTLFYLDPPYWGGENDYGKDMFERADFTRLADQLQAIEGRFILSINDVAEVRELFAWAKIEPVEVRYSIGDNAQLAKELIISML